jgi:hypothetical protein
VGRIIPRLVRNQLLFREVNERLRETVGAFEGPLEFVCECSKDDCIDTVALALEEYERIRSHPNLFVVASGHEQLDLERVVDQGQGYVLVEKTVAADAVVKADPRARGGRR